MGSVYINMFNTSWSSIYTTHNINSFPTHNLSFPSSFKPSYTLPDISVNKCFTFSHLDYNFAGNWSGRSKAFISPPLSPILIFIHIFLSESRILVYYFFSMENLSLFMPLISLKFFWTLTMKYLIFLPLIFLPPWMSLFCLTIWPRCPFS